MKKRPYITHSLQLRYVDETIGGASIESQMNAVFRLLQGTASTDEGLLPDQWLIATGDKDSSYLYKAFDQDGPTTAGLAVLNERNKIRTALQSFTLWNGDEGRTKGASISCIYSRQDKSSSMLKLSMDADADEFRLGTFESAVKLVDDAVNVYGPLYCSLAPEQYDSVFPDRPPVGWILYLPGMLSIQQVPEARLVSPFMNRGAPKTASQLGTLIASVSEGVFSDTNPEHVEIAHSIEIRMADQDLLPRYAEM